MNHSILPLAPLRAGKALPLALLALALTATPIAAQTKKATPKPKATAKPASSGVTAAAAEIAKTASPELVGLLTKSTGVTAKQAEQGAGAIFGYAKTKLKPEDFNKVSDAVPGMDGLLKAAPTADPAPDAGGGGTLGALAGAASQLGGSVGTAAALAPSFQKIGLNAETVTTFLPVVLDYVTKKGGSSTGNLLGGVLK